MKNLATIVLMLVPALGFSQEPSPWTEKNYPFENNAEPGSYQFAAALWHSLADCHAASARLASEVSRLSRETAEQAKQSEQHVEHWMTMSATVAQMGRQVQQNTLKISKLEQRVEHLELNLGSLERRIGQAESEWRSGK